MAYRWTPLIGDFDADDRSVVFHGKLLEPVAEPSTADPAQAQKFPMMGTLISDQSTGDGSISANFRVHRSE